VKAVDLTLIVHHETTDDSAVWWAESPEFPGFSATDVSLDGLRARALEAIRDIAAERGERIGDVQTVLAEDAPA
jgi:hypothetical protein